MTFKLILPFIFALYSFTAHAEKAIWWNIGAANFDNPEKKALYDRTPLEENILTLIEKKNPDFFIFGEYAEGFISESTLVRMKKSLPVKIFFPYNSNVSLGIAVFAKKSFQYSFKKDALTWKDQNCDWADMPERSNYVRSFIQIKSVSQTGKSFNLAPLHTIQPWEEIAENDKGLTYISKKLGAADIAWAVLFKSQNPLAYQAERFQSYLKAHQATTPYESWVVLGDLNVFRSYYGKGSPTYEILKGNLNEGTRLGELNYSFPSEETAAAQTSHKMQIDHAFSTLPESELHYEFFKLLGSDHFPMEVNFTP